MTIKEKKNYLERITEKFIKNILNKEGLAIQTEYDINNGIMKAQFIDEVMNEKNPKLVDSLVVYTVAYNEEKQSLAVNAFNRRFVYDVYGISFVVTDSITLDDNFVNAFKHTLASALSVPEDQYEEILKDPEPEQDAVAEEETAN